MTRGKNIELFICHYVVDFLDFLYCPRVFNTADNSLKAKQIFMNAFLGVFQSSSWLRQMSFYIFSGMVIYACILFEYISLFTSSHFYLTSYHSAILLVKTSSGTKIESQVYCTNLVHCRFTLAVGDDPFFQFGIASSLIVHNFFLVYFSLHRMVRPTLADKRSERDVWF